MTTSYQRRIFTNLKSVEVLIYLDLFFFVHFQILSCDLQSFQGNGLRDRSCIFDLDIQF
jgi:hypothetical protein